MTAKYILIQCIGFLGTGVFFVSYQCRRNKTLFLVQFISYLLYTIHLLLLGAVTGGVSYIINTLRSACLASGKDVLESRRMCAVFCALQLVTLALTWAGPLSILPVAANIASTIGGYTRSAKKIRLTGLFVNSPLWIIYNIFSGSLAGILDEVVSDISIIVSLVRFRKKKTDKETAAPAPLPGNGVVETEEEHV